MEHPIDDTELERPRPEGLRALVIAHEENGGGCEIERRLLQRGVRVDTHLVTADYDRPEVAAPFPPLDGYDLILPMGSVRSLTAKEELGRWIHEELALLRSAHEAGVPILGVCFGGQLMAEALGGSVERAPMAEVGWFEIRAPEGAVNPVGPGPWKEWHHDRFEPPPGAEVLAVTDDAVQLFRVGTTVGTQFHPEVNAPFIEGWVSHADDDYLRSCGVAREQLLKEAETNETANVAQCHHLVDWFLDEVMAPR